MSTVEDAKKAWKDASPALTFAAGLITLVGTAGASGLSAVLSPKPAKAETVITVGKAFHATWPMSVAVALIVLGVSAGAVQRLGGPVSLIVAAGILGAALLIAYPAAPRPNLGGPSQSAEAILDVLGKFLAAYGPSVFFGGFVAGAAVGWFAFRFAVVFNGPAEPGNAGAN